MYYRQKQDSINSIYIYIFLDIKNMKLQKLIAIDTNQHNSIIKMQNMRN